MAAQTEAPGPSSFIAFVQKNSLILYFVLAFIISWIFWFIEPAFRTKDPLVAFILTAFGTYGPVLAAMLVSALSDRTRTPSPLGVRLLAGGLVLVLAIYANWPSIQQVAGGSSAQPLHWLLLAVLVLLPAWVFFNARSSLQGVQNLLRSLVRLPSRWFYLGIALFMMLALSVLGVFLSALFTGQPLSSWIKAFQSSPILDNLLLTFLATALYGGPLGEEAGWRGFALPRLQKRFDPLLASVILGLIWALWHIPLHLTGYYNAAYGSPLSGILMRAFTTIPLTLIFTWLYNRSKGNLLVMMCLHTAVNITSGLVSPGVGLYITTTVAVVLMVVFDRMYRSHPTPPTVAVPPLS